jgi:hypothetical protein
MSADVCFSEMLLFKRDGGSPPPPSLPWGVKDEGHANFFRRASQLPVGIRNHLFGAKTPNLIRLGFHISSSLFIPQLISIQVLYSRDLLANDTIEGP